MTTTRLRQRIGFHPPQKFFLLLAAVLLFLSSAPRATAFHGLTEKKKNTIRCLEMDKVKYVFLDDVATFYGMKAKTSGKEVVLSSFFTKLVFTEDRRDMTLNGTIHYLSFPIRLKNRKHLISLTDFALSIDPVLRPKVIPRHTVKTIVVDAGHGGKDPGCNGGGFLEKDINLQIAILLANQLQKRGYNVLLTRKTDVLPTLKQRVDAVNLQKPDLFISLHCNAGANDTNGLEVFCATPDGTPATDTTTLTTGLCNANAFDLENSYIAHQVQTSAVAAIQAADRGVRRKRYTVIQDTSAPCILVEMGFLTSQTDRGYLTVPEKQTALANAIADAVDAYRHSVRPR